MDKSAVEAIAKLAIQENNKNENFAVLFDSQKIHELERYKEKPDAFRANFKTRMVNEFVAYLNKHGKIDTALFVDHIEGQAKAIIDMGNPESPLWGRHRASLELMRLQEYQDLLTKNNVAMDQQSFIDFVEDNKACFRFMDVDDYEIPTHHVVKNIRKLKLDVSASAEQTVGNYANSATALEAIEIKAAGNEAPPVGFYFSFIPYDGFDEHSVYCSMRAVSDGKKAFLKYRIMGIEDLKYKIAQSLLKIFDEDLTNEDISCQIGTMDYQ